MYHLLANVMTNLEYYRGDQLLWKEDAIVGSVFSMTGLKPGSFGISTNARKPRTMADTLISVLKQNNIPTLWLVRKVFLEETDYQKATERLRNTNVSCPIYFIVSGMKGNEGMVIEKDTNDTNAYY